MSKINAFRDFNHYQFTKRLINALVGGNAPIIIDKNDGTIHVTGTSINTEFYIDEYCKPKNFNLSK